MITSILKERKFKFIKCKDIVPLEQMWMQKKKKKKKKNHMAEKISSS